MSARLKDFWTKNEERYEFLACPKCKKYPKVYITSLNAFYADAVAKCTHFFGKSFYVKVTGPPGTANNFLIEKISEAWNNEVKQEEKLNER